MQPRYPTYAQGRSCEPLHNFLSWVLDLPTLAGKDLE